MVDLGVGRPLGGAFAKGGVVYIADTLLGLIRVCDLYTDKPRVELVASKVMMMMEEGGQGKGKVASSQILYANDVDVGSVTGHVYFTDSSTIVPERVGTRTWDTMTAFKQDYFRGKKSGRLLRYKPETDEVDILADGIWFANGVAMDKDETFVMVTETSLARQVKYHLKGSKENSLEVMVGEFPGYPDGGTCSRESGLCYTPLPSTALPIIVMLGKTPDVVNAFFRTLFLMLPSSFLQMIKPVRYGGVVEIWPGDESSPSTVTRILQDPHGKEIAMLTGVAVFDNKLYMGSLKNPFVGVHDLGE